MSRRVIQVMMLEEEGRILDGLRLRLKLKVGVDRRKLSG